MATWQDIESCIENIQASLEALIENNRKSAKQTTELAKLLKNTQKCNICFEEYSQER